MPDKKPQKKPQPLFKLIDGDKVEVAKPKKKFKMVSAAERELIKEWAINGARIRLLNMNKDKRKSQPTLTEQYDEYFEKVQAVEL